MLKQGYGVGEVGYFEYQESEPEPVNFEKPESVGKIWEAGAEVG